MIYISNSGTMLLRKDSLTN